MLQYNNFSFQGSSTDTFHLSALGSFGLARLGDRVMFKLSYGTHLLVGPLAEGDTPASAAEWWMNSIQFQYGLYAAVNTAGFHLLAEYSRMSNHPLRAERTSSEQFENPASERIAGGLVFPRTFVGIFRTDFYFRSGYIDLFDYWQAENIPKPRAWWFYRFGGEAAYSLTRTTAFYMRPAVDILALRSGSFDSSANVEIGLAFYSDRRTARLYLIYEQTNDTEEIRGKDQPVRLWGLGFSFSA